MRFEWNQVKNRQNQAKHGVSFETAALVFCDPFLLSAPDMRYIDIEQRWYSLGCIETTVLYVTHTMSEDEDGEEIIHIISARNATPGEERRYFAQR